MQTMLPEDFLFFSDLCLFLYSYIITRKYNKSEGAITRGVCNDKY